MSATLEYQDLDFGMNGDNVRIRFLGRYYFDVAKDELEKIGKFSISRKSITFQESENRARHKFLRILDEGLSNLISMNNRPTIYIHSGSDIPLIGTNIFGVVDRGTNVIEVKPLTGCNLNCEYCSVDEGTVSKKTHDFLVEGDYLVNEFSKVAAVKEKAIEAHIGGQSEPTLHPKFLEIVSGLSKVKGVKEIAVDTNGTLLNKKFLSDLKKAGMTRINLSIDAMDPKLASFLVGNAYNVERVLQTAKDVVEAGLKLIIAPVYCPGLNDEEIPKLIKFADSIGGYCGIQNCLPYAKGRNMKKMISLEEFFDLIKKWEKETGVDLSLKDAIYIEKDKMFEKTMKKGEVVEAEVMCPGKYKKEWIAKAKDRCILFYTDEKPKPKVKLRLVRDKHNIYTGVLV